MEVENHYYNVSHTALPALGLEPHPLSESLLHWLFSVVEEHRDRIDQSLLTPTVDWRRAVSDARTQGR